jgi:hypothetical protein
MRNTIVLFLFIIITQIASQNSYTLLLTQINDVQYQCNSPSCSAPIVISASNLRACQIACLTNSNCRTVTYDQSNNQCKLFADIPSQYGSMVTQAGFVTLTAVDNRQLSAGR